MMKKTELLAPAGSFEVMKACIAAGADAVYMGLSRFSARAFAENAGTEDYVSAVDYAHLHGKKLYLTLNTLLKEDELGKEVHPLLDPLYEAGLDGIIVQDTGLMRVLQRDYPDLPLHVSTQATVTGPGMAKIFKALGAVRVVPARELSLAEIRRIKEESGLEVECFIHGALCYSYSGQCLFSSIVGGRSGNRGRCAQSCRMCYQLYDENGRRLNPGNNEYLLSLKDLNTLRLLPELYSAGVDSLKIEGRMKKAEYAAGVTNVYRKYLDLLEELAQKTGSRNPEVLRQAGYRVDPADEKILFDLFNRAGFTDGYLTRHNDKSMVTLKKPAFREENEELNERIRASFIRKEHKTPVSLSYSFEAGACGKLQIAAVLDGQQFIAGAETDEAPEAASGRPADRSSVEKQLTKLGDTGFYVSDISGRLEEGLFLPVSVLNALRRKAVSALEEKILGFYRRTPDRRDSADAAAVNTASSGVEAVRIETAETEDAKSAAEVRKNRLSPALSVLVSTKAQLAEALLSKAEEIYVEASAAEPSEYPGIVGSAAKSGKKCFLVFPQIFREEARLFFKRALQEIRNASFDGFLIRSLEELTWLRGHSVEGEIRADYTIYAMNREARAHLQSLGIAKSTVSVELSEHEIRRTDFTGDELLVYGRLPMMVSANCVLKDTAGCDRKSRTLFMTDRMNNRMPVQCVCTFCMNRILNAMPLSLLSLKKEVLSLRPSSLRLDFTTESREEMRSVVRAFEDVYIRGVDGKEPAEFTRGHFRRKVD